ncbi:hypothetical protein [Mucilaginibacter sp.]|uniref:hypothetical protein n=1 Tax=Mucilaginibacter sp. TaxID=1882438 RepID=UPI0032659809
MNQKEFIEVVILNQLGDIVKLHPYLSFGLIATSIELLGACLDDHSIQKRGESGDRFRMAINVLFPSKYHNYAIKNTPYDLYSELRCGLNHSFLPKPSIALSQRASGNNHLSILNNQLILSAEDFYEDLQNAGLKIIEMINENLIAEKFVLNIGK